MKKAILGAIFFSFLIVPFSAANAQFTAARSQLGRVAGTTGLSSNLETSLSSIITSVLSLIGTIFLALTIYAGFLWMTASGNEDKVTKAKDIITQATIGLAVTLSAYAITYFVTSRLAGSGTNPTAEVEIYCKNASGTCGNIKTTTCDDTPGVNNNFSDSACTTSL